MREFDKVIGGFILFMAAIVFGLKMFGCLPEPAPRKPIEIKIPSATKVGEKTGQTTGNFVSGFVKGLKKSKEDGK